MNFWVFLGFFAQSHSFSFASAKIMLCFDEKEEQQEQNIIDLILILQYGLAHWEM